MLFRMVRPMRRKGTRFQGYVRRLPVDVRDKLVGRTLHFPLGDTTHSVAISSRAQSKGSVGRDYGRGFSIKSLAKAMAQIVPPVDLKELTWPLPLRADYPTRRSFSIPEP
jgi:hypothetical protein